MVTACATLTPRSDPHANQDACAAGQDWVVVADGVGSLPESAAAAQAAVAYCTSVLGAAVTGSPDTEQGWANAHPPLSMGYVQDLFAGAHQQVLTEVVRGTGACTLLTGLAHPDGSLTLGACGNGAALLAVHDPDQFYPDRGRVALTTLTVPQISYRAGADQLEQYLGALRPPQPEVTHLGPSSRARLLLVVSDGLYSPEQVTVGKDHLGSHWLSLSPTWLTLSNLARTVLTLPQAPDPDLLHELAAALLASLLTDGHLDDDASLALLFQPATTGA